MTRQSSVDPRIIGRQRLDTEINVEELRYPDISI